MLSTNAEGIEKCIRWGNRCSVGTTSEKEVEKVQNFVEILQKTISCNLVFYSSNLFFSRLLSTWSLSISLSLSLFSFSLGSVCLSLSHTHTYTQSISLLSFLSSSTIVNFFFLSWNIHGNVDYRRQITKPRQNCKVYKCYLIIVYSTYRSKFTGNTGCQAPSRIRSPWTGYRFLRISDSRFPRSYRGRQAPWEWQPCFRIGSNSWVQTTKSPSSSLGMDSCILHLPIDDSGQ